VPSHEVAYTAGFFDGEGCVNIARYQKRGRPYHTLAIIFTNTDFQVVAAAALGWKSLQADPAQRPAPPLPGPPPERGPSAPATVGDAPLPGRQEIAGGNCFGVHRLQKRKPWRSAGRSCGHGQKSCPGGQDAPTPLRIQVH